MSRASLKEDPARVGKASGNKFPEEKPLDIRCECAFLMPMRRFSAASLLPKSVYLKWKFIESAEGERLEGKSNVIPDVKQSKLLSTPSKLPTNYVTWVRFAVRFPSKARSCRDFLCKGDKREVTEAVYGQRKTCKTLKVQRDSTKRTWTEHKHGLLWKLLEQSKLSSENSFAIHRSSFLLFI